MSESLRKDFLLQQNETFLTVFQRMAGLSSEAVDDLYISLGEKRILPEDTPSGIDLSVADIMGNSPKLSSIIDNEWL